MLPRTMLEYLGNTNIFVSDVYIYDRYDIICQLHYPYLEKYFILKQHDLTYRLLNSNCYVSTSDDIYIYIYFLGQGKYPTFKFN